MPSLIVQIAEDYRPWRHWARRSILLLSLWHTNVCSFPMSIFLICAAYAQENASTIEKFANHALPDVLFQRCRQ